VEKHNGQGLAPNSNTVSHDATLEERSFNASAHIKPVHCCGLVRGEMPNSQYLAKRPKIDWKFRKAIHGMHLAAD
jgi:hypothetical protein